MNSATVSSRKPGVITPFTRHTRERHAVVLAQQAYRTFGAECFRSFAPDLEITITKVDWVIERLLHLGRAPARDCARRIQALLSR